MEGKMRLATTRALVGLCSVAAVTPCMGETVQCDFISSGLAAEIQYIDTTFAGSYDETNDLIIINKGSYTVDSIRMIQNCGGVENDVLRGPDIMLDQAAVFKLVTEVGGTPCSYQLRGFIKSGSSKTWSLNASTRSFKFGGSLFKVTGTQYDYNHQCYSSEPL